MGFTALHMEACAPSFSIFWRISEELVSQVSKFSSFLFYASDRSEIHHKTKAVFLAEKKGGVLNPDVDCHGFK